MRDDDSLLHEIAGEQHHDAEHAPESLDGEDGAAAPGRTGRRRADDRDAHRRSPLRTALPALLVIALIAVLGVGGVIGYRWVTGNVSVQEQATEYPGPGEGEATIEIVEGDTGSAIADKLVAAEVIRTPSTFTALFSKTPEAGSISPGAYTLKKHMTASGALEMLLDPESVAGNRITIPEGMRMSDVFTRLSKETGIPVKEFEAAAKDYRALGVPANKAKSAEGWLWPGRYDIAEDATAESILTEMVTRMKSELKSLGVADDERERILTLASIAEKEARESSDYGKVVRTIENRLDGIGEAKGTPMKLQLDSTVAYASGKSTISTTPEERAADSPYNTYLHAGLPVGPISNPGAATIKAAMDPPAGDWLYWVTVNTDTGETKFSTTKAQHDKAVAEWRAWYKKKNG